MNKDEMRSFIWKECLVLSAEKQSQFNKGKRAAYEVMWKALGGDVKQPDVKEEE
jgi:hypothetical protein